MSNVWLQAEITHRNVTSSNILGMKEIRWQDLPSPDARLLWARKRWQEQAGAVEGSAKDAADSMGVEPGTYRAYERPPTSSKHTKLDVQAAIQFGKKFKVSWPWLLTGEGTPFDGFHPKNQRRVLTAMGALPEDEQEKVADMIEAFAKRRAG